MTGAQQPVCWIIAGSNGAGKTTFALKYLPEVASCQRFVNVDLIAAGLSPLAPEREQRAASRLYLAEIERWVRARCYLNSADPPLPVFAEQGGARDILDRDIYEHLMQEARR